MTFLMGGNDVCSSSRQTMTSVCDFRLQFRAAMDQLATGLPEADVFVASIPDVHHRWELYHTDPLAR